MNLNFQIIETVAKHAGISGIWAAIFLFLSQDVLARINFGKLTKDQVYKLIQLLIILTASIGVIGMTGWFFLDNNDVVVKEVLDAYKIIIMEYSPRPEDVSNGDRDKLTYARSLLETTAPEAVINAADDLDNAILSLVKKGVDDKESKVAYSTAYNALKTAIANMIKRRSS